MTRAVSFRPKPLWLGKVEPNIHTNKMNNTNRRNCPFVLDLPPPMLDATGTTRHTNPRTNSSSLTNYRRSARRLSRAPGGSGARDPCAAAGARLNLSAPTPQKAIIFTAMFNMYHTLKVGHRSVVDVAFLQNHFGQCCKIAGNVAREYWSQYASFFTPPGFNPSATHVQSSGRL